MGSSAWAGKWIRAMRRVHWCYRRARWTEETVRRNSLRTRHMALLIIGAPEHLSNKHFRRTSKSFAAVSYSPLPVKCTEHAYSHAKLLFPSSLLPLPSQAGTRNSTPERPTMAPESTTSSSRPVSCHGSPIPISSPTSLARTTVQSGSICTRALSTSKEKRLSSET